MNKFIQRFKQGDFNYCTHRLRKFSRRRNKAVEAIKFVLQNHESFLNSMNGSRRFVEELINLNVEMAVTTNISYLDLARVALNSEQNDLWEKIVAEAPDKALPEIIKIAAERKNGTACSPIRRYLLAARKHGLLNAIRKAYILKDEILFKAQPLFYNKSSEKKEVEIFLDEFKREVFDDFIGLFQEKVLTSAVIADDCKITNEFGAFDFASANEFVQWANDLANDRGPLTVDTASPIDLLKNPGFDLYEFGWMDRRVAVVKGSGNSKILFVVAICGNLHDGKIRKIWLSTDNHLLNLDFANPRHKDTEPQGTPTTDTPTAESKPKQPNDIHSMDTNRPDRANDLARAIAAWNENKTDRTFSVAVWGIGVDAVFGKTVFVPTSISEDGNLVAMGPVDGNGNKLYVCHVDLPDTTEKNCIAHSEMLLSGFLKMVIEDSKAVGAAILLDDTKLLVGRDYLEDLAKKIGC